jgi:hypothetical protein
MAEGPERAGLVGHCHEPVTQRPLNAPGDVTLVVEQRIESGPGQPPDDHVRLGDDGSGAGGIGQERHLPEDLARAEGRDGRPSRAVGGGLSNDAGAHGRPPILDHVEAVGAVALRTTIWPAAKRFSSSSPARRARSSRPRWEKRGSARAPPPSRVGSSMSGTDRGPAPARHEAPARGRPSRPPRPRGGGRRRGTRGTPWSPRSPGGPICPRPESR